MVIKVDRGGGGFNSGVKGLMKTKDLENVM